MPNSSRLRGGVAIALLALLLGTIGVLGARATFRTAPSVDSRTYIEMIRGFADNQLPHLDNAPAADLAEGQARWNVYHGGRLWGVYPPLFPFLASFPFRSGGLPLVTQLNCIVSLGLIALGAAALGTRLSRDALAGTAAAYATVFATFIGALGIGIDSFALCTALVVWSCYFGLRSIDDGTRRYALAAGAAGGGGAAAHLLGLPMLVGLVAAVALLRRADEAPFGHGSAQRIQRAGRLEPWIPSRASLTRALLILVASAVVLSPVAWLNHLRFDSFSPATYGPCVWEFCASNRPDKMTLAATLAYAMPVALCLGAAVLVLWYLRHGPWRWLLVPLAVATLVLWPALRRQGLDIVVCTVAYIADNASFALPPFTKPADGLGNFFGPFVVKSLLQGSPYMALALVAPWIVPEPRRVVALLLPVGALLGLLGVRAHIQLVHSLGFPFLFLRYLAPAMPILAVLAVASARHLRLGVAGWLTLAVTGAAGAYVLWGGNDEPLLRRVLVLRVTLIVGVGAAVLGLMRARRPLLGAGFGVFAGAAFGLAMAISMAIDVREIWSQRVTQDAMLARVESKVPARFAVVGWAAQIDPILSLRASHDVQYIDLHEARDWSGSRTMIERWSDEGRPIYAVWPRHAEVKSPWTDVSWEPVDPQLGMFRVQKK